MYVGRTMGDATHARGVQLWHADPVECTVYGGASHVQRLQLAPITCKEVGATGREAVGMQQAAGQAQCTQLWCTVLQCWQVHFHEGQFHNGELPHGPARKQPCDRISCMRECPSSKAHPIVWTPVVGWGVDDGRHSIKPPQLLCLPEVVEDGQASDTVIWMGCQACIESLDAADIFSGTHVGPWP